MIQVNEFSTVMEDGRIINWSRQIREEIEQESENPDRGIRLEMCEWRALADMRKIIQAA